MRSRFSPLGPLLLGVALSVGEARQGAHTRTQSSTARSNAGGRASVEATTAHASRVAQEQRAPRRLAPWRPSTPDPSDVWVEALLDELIPDPRGLAYVRATVMLTEPRTGQRHTTEVRGWIDEDPQRPGRRRLLAWNSLWYPIIDTIGPAKLQPDLETVAAGRALTPVGQGDASPLERFSLMSASAQGRVLARRLGADPGAVTDFNRAIVIEWLISALKWQIECAHVRGDHALQLASARRLLRASVLSHAKWQHRFALEWIDDARRPRATGAVPPPLDRAATPAQQAKTLVAALDQVAGLEWDDDPLLDQLVQIGEPAIDALLDAVEHDRRSTRRFAHDMRHDEYLGLIRVSTLAGELVPQILNPGCLGFNFSPSGTPRHDTTLAPMPVDVAEFRALWNTLRHLSPLDRHVRALEDDLADPAEWSFHLHALTQTARSACGRPHDITPREARSADLESEPGPMIAQSLFDRRDSALGSLIARRVQTTIERSAASPDDARLRANAEQITMGQLFWERDPRVLRATRARWVALSAASDDEAARLVHAIDERTAELQRASRIAHNPRRP